MRHHQFIRVLADVLPQTVVYVVAHCSRGSDHVQDNNENTLDYIQLANRIHTDGLRLGHRVMKLYICEGALGDDRLPTNSPGSQSFAKKFLGAMRTIGYNDLELYAYSGSVSSVHSDDQHRYEFVEGATNPKEFRAHEIRVAVIG